MFFFVALRWAPRPFGGARAKKKHHPSGPGERQGKEGGRRHGARAKKKNTAQGVFFFAPAPGKGRGRRSPAWAPARGQSKKTKTPGWCFFLLWPRAGAQRGFSFPCLSPGPQQNKKLPGRCFFLLWPRAGTGLLLPLPFPGAGAKQKTPWVVFFFFAAAPRGRSLTHCGPGWRCLPLAGVVFVFFAAGRGRTGVVFFFLLWPRPDAHSLTVGWGDFGKARVVFFFFAAALPGLFRQ